MLKVLPVRVYGTASSVLLDTGAVQKRIWAELADHLNLVTKPTQKTITVTQPSKGIIPATPGDCGTNYTYTGRRIARVFELKP